MLPPHPEWGVWPEREEPEAHREQSIRERPQQEVRGAEEVPVQMQTSEVSSVTF